jgi:hypothetical protein
MGTSNGNGKYYKPEDLLRLWNEYKAFIDTNPDELEQLSNKGEIMIVRVKKPYLQEGFYAFVYNNYGHHIHQYIDNTNGAYDDYLGVVTHIRSEWRNDQISGSLTGRYKAPNLVARLNGISDNKNIDLKTEQPLFGKE